MSIKKFLKSAMIVSLIAAPIYSFAAATDAMIDKEITSKLSASPALSGTSINVKTSKYVVNLSGNVDSDTQASAATEIAQSTPYVKDVKTDDLMIKGSQHVVDDTLITAKIKGMFIQKKLFGDKDIAAYSISVETNNGTVSLSGSADNKKEIENAIIIAKSISGVKEVKSSVNIVPVTQ